MQTFIELKTMDMLHKHWEQALRKPLHRSLTILIEGVVLGYGTMLVRRTSNGYDLPGDEERALCLLSVVQGRPQSSNPLPALRKAIHCWERDEKALAHIHLAFARLGTVDTPEDAWRLFLADELIVAGMTPRELAKAINVPLPMASFSKYDPEQPRNPAGSGRVSGQWTKNPSAGPSAARVPTLSAAAPSLTETLGAGALEWLTRLAGRLSLPAALFGAIFVPSPNPGISGSGAVPGHPGLNYQLDRDTGTLRLSLESDPNPDHALVAELSSDGIYRDVETRVAIARAIGSEVVLIDLDVAPDLGPGGGRRASMPTTSRNCAPTQAKISPAAASFSTFSTSNMCATSSIRSGNRSFLRASPLRCRRIRRPAGCVMMIVEKPTAR